MRWMSSLCAGLSHRLYSNGYGRRALIFFMITIMYDDLIKKTETAIDNSLHWAERGWSVTFGPRQTEINSLQAAEELPETYVYRMEAINYWKQVRLTGHDAGVSGQKALESLKKGDLRDAEDHLYFSQYVEKPFAEFSKTWVKVYEAAKAQMLDDQ